MSPVIERINVILSQWKTWPAKLYLWYIDNFILVGLAIAVIIALSYPLPGAYLSAISVGSLHIRIFSFIASCILFLINGLSLKTNDLRSLYQKKYYFMYGLICINFITTLLAFVMLLLPLAPYEFSIGLAIFCTVPTTLGIGVSLTTASKGDTPLALILTVFSNLLGAITVPLLLKLYLASVSAATVDTVPLLTQLILCVLIPIITGIIMIFYVHVYKIQNS